MRGSAEKEPFMELLRSLRKEQILEVLSGGFCQHCEDRVQARITSLRKRKLYEKSHSDNDFASSRDASRMPVNGNASEFHTRRRDGRQEDSLRNTFQRHESDLSMKRSRHATNSSPRYLNSRRQFLIQSDSDSLFNDASGRDFPFERGLSEEHDEYHWYAQDGRKKDFVQTRRVEKQGDSRRNSFQRHESTSLMKRNRHAVDSSPRYLNRKGQYLMQSDFEEFLNDDIDGDSPFESGLSEEQEEHIRRSQVARKKDFVHIRRAEIRGDSHQSSFQRHESTLSKKRDRLAIDSSPRDLNNSRKQSLMQSDSELLSRDNLGGDLTFKCDLSEEEGEYIRRSQVGRDKDFDHFRRVEIQGDDPRSSFQRHESTLSMKRNRQATDSSTRSLNNSRKQYLMQSDSDLLSNDNLGGDFLFKCDLSEEKEEYIRCSQVGRKMDFEHFEVIKGRNTNVLQGLELHTQVFNVEEQKNIIEYVYKLQRMGRNGQLRERTYSEPRKWMRGKGRVTIQFGCCYNYAVDKNGNPPGIIRHEEVDQLPPLFKQMIKRMVKWHILPSTCIPDSCIVNIYDKGDCIPPHIDHHDFVRPFSTVSLLSECNIVFGSNLKVTSPGQFLGPVAIPLPVGSVFIINGNGANVAKHCVPSVPTKRISITFRKMDDSKLPYNFSPAPELVGIEPLPYSPMNKTVIEHDSIKNSEIQQQKQHSVESDEVREITKELSHEED